MALLIKGLGQSGFSADSVGTVGDAHHVLATMKYAAIVLDLGHSRYLVKPYELSELAAAIDAAG